MIRPLLRLGDPRLRDACAPATPGAHVDALIADMRDTLRDARARSGYGRGIAAPQIGVTTRVVYLDEPRPLALLNPAIVERSRETVVVWDACLSFLEVFCQVVRHAGVVVRYQAPDGAWHTFDALADQHSSELLQHELDHLDGVLAVDRMIDPRTLCLRDQFEARHAPGTAYARA